MKDARNADPARMSPAFAAAVGGELRAALELEPGTVYALDADHRIAYLNPAWFVFAAQNGGQALLDRQVIGMSLWSAIPDVLEPFYRAALTAAAETRKPWSHDYDCSSPAVKRELRMRVLPLERQPFLVVINDVIRETLHDPPAGPHRNYVAGNGFITQCANCRRTLRRPSEPPEWDWVPGLLAPAPNVTHGLCKTCLEYHYPEVD